MESNEDKLKSFVHFQIQRNVIALYKKYINLIEDMQEDHINMLNKLNSKVDLQTLKNVEHILNDRLLKYSIQIDFNYFNLNIIDHVINGTDVHFTVTAERILNKENNEIEKKQTFSVIRYNEDKKKTDTVLDSDKVDFYDFVNKAFKKPTIVFPAKFFIEDVFGDCNISENAFNIMILTITEKKLFTQIRNRKVKEVKLLPENDKIGKVPYSILDDKGKLNTESIKTIKGLMGTKAYEKGFATLTDGKKLEFSPKAYAPENK